MRFRRARQTAWRTIGEETIVLDLAHKRMIGLNETAAFVWQALDAMAELEVLWRALSTAGEARFDVAELTAFLEELVTLGIVEAEVASLEVATEAPQPVDLTPPTELEPPRILWQETVEQVAATCAFFPAQNPLCNQVPFS